MWAYWGLAAWGACCNERMYSVAGRAQALDLPPFQGVAGDVGFAVMSDEGIAEVDNT